MRENIKKWVWQHEEYNCIRQIENTADRNIRYE